MQKESQESTESSENTKNETQDVRSTPRIIDNTEEMLGKSIAIVGAPPPQKRR